MIKKKRKYKVEEAEKRWNFYCTGLGGKYHFGLGKEAKMSYFGQYINHTVYSTPLLKK